jgi:hypothetical protein
MGTTCDRFTCRGRCPCRLCCEVFSAFSSASGWPGRAGRTPFGRRRVGSTRCERRVPVRCGLVSSIRPVARSTHR